MKKSSKTLKRLIVVFTFLAFIAGFLTFVYIFNFGYNAPILMYHYIQSHESETSKLVVSPFHFERHMRYLHENRYQVVALETLLQWTSQRKKIPHKTVAITMDDGYLDNYEHAYPVLKKYGFPATIFLIIDTVGRPGYLTWHQIHEMEIGGIRFGSHTLTHPTLTEIPLDQAQHEISESKRQLAAMLKSPSPIFSYPSGRTNAQLKEAVRGSGYGGAVSGSPDGITPIHDPFGFKRVRISNTSNNLYVFWLESSGYYGFIRHIRKKIKNRWIALKKTASPAE